MYNRFYQESLISKYIQGLLQKIPVPTIRIYEDDMYLKAGEQVITKYGIYKSTKTDGNVSLTDLEKVCDYKFGDYLPGYTTTYISSEDGYDPYTHYYLGQYLRLVKCFYNVDLMPLYNCYAGKVVSSIYLLDKDNTIYETNDNFTVYSVPVKFGKVYTIGIDSISGATFRCGMITKKGVVDKLTDIDVFKQTYRREASCRFNQPFLYNNLQNINNEYNELISKESCLRLFIQVPRNIKTSLYVLEGDYIACCRTDLSGVFRDKDILFIPGPVISDELAISESLVIDNDKYTGANINYGPSPIVTRVKGVPLQSDQPFGENTGSSFLSIEPRQTKPYLSNFSDGEKYAYSPNLISYLTGNAITYQDWIRENIERVYNTITSEKFFRAFGYKYSESYDHEKGFLDENMIDFLYFIAVTNQTVLNNNPLDVNGFVDAYMENLISRGS